LISSILPKNEQKNERNQTDSTMIDFFCSCFERNVDALICSPDLLRAVLVSQVAGLNPIHYLLFRVKNLVCLFVDQPKQARASYAIGLLINFITSLLPSFK
jgi:hypothetical protein